MIRQNRPVLIYSIPINKLEKLSKQNWQHNTYVVDLPDLMAISKTSTSLLPKTRT